MPVGPVPGPGVDAVTRRALCYACGLRQLARTGYCVGCDCPLGALAPPPTLSHAVLPPQRLVSRARRAWWRVRRALGVA